MQLCANYSVSNVSRLVTVLEAILTTSLNLVRNYVYCSENNMNFELKLATKQRIVLKNLGGESVLKFLQSLVLDFPHICL